MKRIVHLRKNFVSSQIKKIDGELAKINKEIKELAVEVVASPIRNQESEIIGVVTVIHDVSRSREFSKKLSFQASHDSLTGLFNRAKFEECLQEVISNARSENGEYALCYLDLDNFKIVNDSCGHFAGDQLLKQLTLIIREEIRKSDIFARLGGDE